MVTTMRKATRGSRRILSRTEVSAMFGVSPSTITRWARQGRLPCIHTLGGHRRYLADDVQRLVDEAQTSTDVRTDRRTAR